MFQHFPQAAFVKSKASFFKKKRRDEDDDDEDGGGGEGRSSGPVAPEALYLKIDNGEAEQSSEYAKEDLWILSTSPDFAADAATGERRALSSAGSGPGFTFVARGVYHGRSSRGMIELKAPLPFDRCTRSSSFVGCVVPVRPRDTLRP